MLVLFVKEVLAAPSLDTRYDIFKQPFPPLNSFKIR